jgi:iron(III) transport system ATP-binding protein
MLGPSGVGKTTLLRLLAGFDRPDSGSISVGGRMLADEQTHVTPEKRRIGYVPQEGSLFPHLTVTANVGFGLARAQRRNGVGDLLELVGLADLGERYPHQLSGGQQHRVALARALAVKPEVVLLDEPFASLDAQLRAGVREDVRRILRESGTTALLVTHNQDEALSSADLVAVLRAGRVVQCTTPHQLYSGPADGELASFVGDANLLDGTLHEGYVDTQLGRLLARSRSEVTIGETPCDVTVLLRPEQITVSAVADNDAPTAQIVECEYHGHDTVLSVRLGDAKLLARSLGDAGLAPGQSVTLSAFGPVLVWPRGAKR